jgi:hypothetical protein
VETSRINSLSGFKWEPVGSTHSLDSLGFDQSSQINSSLASIGNQPDQLTLWLHRATTSPAGSTHSLASNGNQQDQLTLWLHRSSLNRTPYRVSLSEHQHPQQSSKQRRRQPTSTTSLPAITIISRPVTSRAPLQLRIMQAV